jgi:hypothetical protein
MIQIIRAFLVKAGCEDIFILAYGPGGAWSNLFDRSPGYRGTTMLSDTHNPRRYLTMDLWNDQIQWEQALADNQAKYTELEASFAEWTESQTEIGIFSVRAEATVRPRGKTRRR